MASKCGCLEVFAPSAAEAPFILENFSLVYLSRTYIAVHSKILLQLLFSLPSSAHIKTIAVECSQGMITINSLILRNPLCKLAKKHPRIYIYILRFVRRCPTETRNCVWKFFGRRLGPRSSSTKATMLDLSPIPILSPSPRVFNLLLHPLYRVNPLRSTSTLRPDLSINCKYYRVFQYWKTVADWLPITFGPTISFSLPIARLLFSLLFSLFVCLSRADWEHGKTGE